MHYLSCKEFSGIHSSVSDHHWVAPQSLFHCLGKLWVHISGTFGGFRCPPSTALQCYLRIQVLAWDLQYTFFWTLLQENGWRNLVWISSRDPKRKAPVDRFLVATFREPCSQLSWAVWNPTSEALHVAALRGPFEGGACLFSGPTAVKKGRNVLRVSTDTSVRQERCLCIWATSAVIPFFLLQRSRWSYWLPESVDMHLPVHSFWMLAWELRVKAREQRQPSLNFGP